MGPGCNLSIHKFAYSQPRTISFDKITVSDEYFEKIHDFNFWPAKTYVREYFRNLKKKLILHSDRLLIVYQYVGGLNSKLSKLFVDSHDFMYDVFVFNETWLNESVFNAVILCNKY